MHSSTRSNLPDKACAVCGRPITWRKKWERCWDEIRLCSTACRSAEKRSDAQADAVEAAILAMLSERDPNATICPSEVARALFPESWRKEMETIRHAARRLQAKELVIAKQEGRQVDLARARGPVRIGRGKRYKA